MWILSDFAGLITPSLDEMVHVAREMERQNMHIPLLIGGATTSKTHTAVKIEPNYTKGLAHHVLDASRAVAVASSLLTADATLKAEYIQSIRQDYEQVRILRGNRKSSKKYLTLRQARQNKTPIDWTNFEPIKPTFLGIKTFEDYDLNELRSYIDWTPFFQSWQMAGKFPAILTDEIVGVEATKLYNEAQKMIDRIIAEKWISARAVIGFWEANAINDDDILLKNDSDTEGVVLHNLRQQNQKAPGQPNYCLSDFIAPKETGMTDYIGGFATTAGIGIEKWVEKFEKELDDFNAILLKSLADRFAEAFAERMHERVRKEFWGYDTSEILDTEQLIEEEYKGIRPAPGYPACPDHTEKATLWELLKPEENAGITLTESFAMYPTAAVSGWYFAHPDSKYFGLGQISKDQVEDYSERKGFGLEETERWLAPVLNYDV